MDADQNADRDADEKSNDGVEGHRLDSIQVQLCKERSCPATNGSSSTTTTKEKVTTEVFLSAQCQLISDLLCTYSGT